MSCISTVFDAMRFIKSNCFDRLVLIMKICREVNEISKILCADKPEFKESYLTTVQLRSTVHVKQTGIAFRFCRLGRTTPCCNNA